jgi:hypothetical protein
MVGKCIQDITQKVYNYPNSKFTFLNRKLKKITLWNIFKIINMII